MNNESNIFYLSDSWKIVKKYYKKIIRNVLIVSAIVFGCSFFVNKTTVDLRVDLLELENLIYEDEYINLKSILKKLEFSKIYLDELEESLKYDKQDGDIVRELLDEINMFRVQYNEWKIEMSSLISVPYIEKDTFYNKVYQSAKEYLRRIKSTEIMNELIDLRVDLLELENLIYEDEYINLKSILKKLEFSKIYLDELEESLKYDKQDGDIVRELLDEINMFRVQYNEWKIEMSSLISVPYIEKDTFYNKVYQSAKEYLRRIKSTEIMNELIDEFGEEYLENTEENRLLSILESINNLQINEKYYDDYSKIEDKILTYTKEEWNNEYRQFIQMLADKVDEYNELINSLNEKIIDIAERNRLEIRTDIKSVNGKYNELINSLNEKIIDIAERNRLEIRTDIKSVNGKEEYQVIVIPMDMPENRTQLLLSMEVLGFCFTVILSILYYSKVENGKHKKNTI